MREYLKKAYYTVKYFLFRIKRTPIILDMEKTVNLIVDNNLSVSRYGEGEFRKMFDDSYKYKNRLFSAFQNESPNLLTCVSGMIYANIYRLAKSCRHFYRWYGTYYGLKTTRLLGKKRKYGEACITRFYLDYKKKDFDHKLPSHIQNMKKIWEKRNILFVEGEHSKNGVGNDLYDNALSIRRILCPDKDSIEIVDKIKDHILKHYKDGDLVLVSSGFAGSIICSELGATTNIQCVDIGNLDVEYIWYLNKCTKKRFIKGKNSAEAVDGPDAIVLKEDAEKYQSEIIDRIIK